MSSAVALPAPERLRILFAYANPLPGPATGAEIEDGALALALEPMSLRIHYQSQPGCSRGDLIRRLTLFRPHVLHLAGHGNPDGSVALLHPGSGEAFPLGKKDLAAILQGRPELRYIVFTSCYGLVDVEALAEVADAVIGVRGELQEPDPVVFSASLYHSIACGQSIENAVSHAVAETEERRAPGFPCFEVWKSPDAARRSARGVTAHPLPRDLVGPARARGSITAWIAAAIAAGASGFGFFFTEWLPPLFPWGTLALAALASLLMGKPTPGARRGATAGWLAATVVLALVYATAQQLTTVAVPDYAGARLQVGFHLVDASLTPEARAYVHENKLRTLAELAAWSTYDQDAVKRAWTTGSIHTAGALLVALFVLGTAVAARALALLLGALRT